MDLQEICHGHTMVHSFVSPGTAPAESLQDEPDLSGASPSSGRKQESTVYSSGRWGGSQSECYLSALTADSVSNTRPGSLVFFHGRQNMLGWVSEMGLACS